MIEALNKEIKSKMLFKFIEPTCPNVGGAPSASSGIEEVVKTVYNTGHFSPTAARIPAPLGKTGDINIARDFRWTKTKSNTQARKNVPVLTLREMQVVVPAFYSNLQLLFDTVSNEQGTGVANAANSLAGLVDSDSFMGYGGAFKSFVDNVDKGMAAIGNKVSDLKTHFTGAQQFNFPAYLKDYEKIYGVKQTNFIYRLPYLDNQVKTIETSWGETDDALSNVTTKPLKALEGVARAYSSGVGIDFAKTFAYPDSGPSHNINFYLDNTRIDDQSDALLNYRFIYLLLYQNLPNRINRTSLTPPVIYQSSVPGVFSYRWSYLSNIQISFIGVRRPVNMVVGEGESVSEVIIPEGYNIQLTLTSLTPETKNLMYDSINNPVKSYVSDAKPGQTTPQDPTAGPPPLPDELVGVESKPGFFESWNPRAWNKEPSP